MKFIVGKKLDMTQVWKGDEAIAVTRVQAGPCVVTQVKDEKKDGYRAVQIGYGEKKEKNIAKPQLGHLKKAGVNSRYLREFKIAIDTPNGAKERQDEASLKVGDKVDVGTFEAGDNIKVTGISKGKGFQGVVKRHGFHGQDASHGTKDQLRMPGSIGATGPAHVFKGVRMPGRMGGDRVSLSNLEIVEVDKENNILLIKGAVPGARNGLVLISGEGELKITPSDAKDTPKGAKEKQQIATEEKVGEKRVENIEQKTEKTPKESKLPTGQEEEKSEEKK
jgi:large subunit ribosomal protein L3